MIATTSTDEKARRLRELGADAVINYVQTPEWSAEVLALTDGRGVERVVEVGGSGTIAQSIKSVAHAGEIALVGMLDPTPEGMSLIDFFLSQSTLRTIGIGSRDDLENMSRALSFHGVHPIIDRVFAFERGTPGVRVLRRRTALRQGRDHPLGDQNMTDTEANKALVNRYFTAIEEGDLTALDEVVSTDYEDHAPGRQPGRGALKAAAQTLRVAFPDMTSTVTHMMAEGDLIAVRNRVTGTQRGLLGELPATGNRVDFTALQLFRVEDELHRRTLGDLRRSHPHAAVERLRWPTSDSSGAATWVRQSRGRRSRPATPS